MQEFLWWSNTKLERDYCIRTMNGFSHFLKHSLKCKRYYTYSWSWNDCSFFCLLKVFIQLLFILLLFYYLYYCTIAKTVRLPLIAHWGTEALDIKRQSKMFIEKLKQIFRLWNQITIRLLFCRRERWYELESDCWVG